MRCTGFATLILTILVHSAGTAEAQFPPGQIRPAGTDADRVPNVQLVEAQQLLERITISLQKSDWSQAARELDLLIGQTSDSEDLSLLTETSIGNSETSQNAGLKRSIDRIFAAQPRELQNAYQQQVGPEADSRLPELLGSGNAQQLGQFADRYRHTDAGRRALVLLEHRYAMSGRYLDAAFAALRQMQEGPASSAPRARAIAYLIDAGLITDAVQLGSAADGANADGRISIGGKMVPLPAADANLSEWVRQHLDGIRSDYPDPDFHGWTTAFGSRKRTLEGPSIPFAWEFAWSASVLQSGFDDRVNEILREAESTIQRRLASPVTAAAVSPHAIQPLIIGRHVIYRSIGTIRAVDIETGELAWETFNFDSRVKNQIDPLIAGGPQAPRNPNADPRRLDPISVPEFNASGLASRLTYAIVTRACRDNTCGQLSSDGRLVFCVEDSWDRPGLVSRTSLGVQVGNATNTIRAYEADSGRLLGAVGGSPGSGNSSALSGKFFLGAPLVLGDCLFVLAEEDEEIRLLKLRMFEEAVELPDAPSAQGDDAGESLTTLSLRLEWSQHIAWPEEPVTRHPLRAYAGDTPAYAQGLLICGTTSGQLVAVSPADQSFRWVYQYPTTVRSDVVPGRQAVLRGATTTDESELLDMRDRWLDALPRVVDDAVLVTPRDSDQLHCLDLETGQLRWSRVRGDLRAIGACVEGSVLMLARTGVVSLALDSGEELWRTEFPKGWLAGSAVLSGGVLNVPTSDSSIVSIDSRNGRILLTTSGPDQVPLGNLATVDGTTISQSMPLITAFRAASSESVLTLDPVLAQARELLLRGEPDAAEKLLSAGDPAELSPAARVLLMESWLEGLRLDFGGYRQQIPQLQQLIAQQSVDERDVSRLLLNALAIDPVALADLSTDAATLAEYRRLQSRMSQYVLSGMIDGHDVSPESVAAAIYDSLLAAGEQTGSARRGSITVKLTRSTAAEVRRLFLTMPEANRDSVRALLGERLKQQVADTSLPGTLEMIDLLNTAGLDAITANVVLSDWEKLSAELPPLRRERLLLSWMQNPDPAISAMALRIVAEDWQAEDPRTDARAAVNEFARRIALQNGVTLDAELLAEPSDVVQQGVWKGKPKVSEEDPPAPGQSNRLPDERLVRSVPVYGQSGAFPQWTFTTDERESSIIAWDAELRKRWQLQLPMWSNRRPTQIFERYLLVSGHLLLLKLEHLIAAIDVADTERPELLWHRDLRLSSPEAFRQALVPIWQRPSVYDDAPHGFLPVGPLTPDTVVLLSGSDLFGLDPLTGSQQWRIEDVPIDTLLLGDNTMLLLLSESAGRIEVRDPVDGGLFRAVPLPDWWNEANWNRAMPILDAEPEAERPVYWRLRIAGRHALRFVRTTETGRLEMVDLATDTVTWKRELTPGTVVSNATEDFVAFVTEFGHSEVLRVSDGVTVAEAEVNPIARLRALYLRDHPSRFVLMTDALDEDLDYEVLPAASQAAIHGLMWAMDRQTGQPAWQIEIEHVSIRETNPATAVFPTTLPVVPLIARRRNAAIGNEVSFGSHYETQLIDVMDGGLIYENSDVGRSLSTYCVVPDGDKRRILMAFDAGNVTLNWRDAEEGAETGRREERNDAEDSDRIEKR